MANFSIQQNLSMSSNARHADVIVIGGGVSGLVAASEVKHYDPGIEVVTPNLCGCLTDLIGSLKLGNVRFFYSPFVVLIGLCIS